MRRDPKAFRERFKAWKNGLLVYLGGRPTDLYLDTMERVARLNADNWGVSEDEALIHALNDNSYDYQGYYDKYPESSADSRSHWTDEFKTVYHPTFSNESRYHGKKSLYNPYGLRGGTWIGDKFQPAPWLSRTKAWRINKLGYEDGKDDLPEGFLFDTDMPELTVYGDVERARRQNNWLTRRGLFPRFYSLGNGQGVKEIKTPTEKGLEIVSPEFYVLGGLRPGGDIIAPITKNQVKSIGRVVGNTMMNRVLKIPAVSNIERRAIESAMRTTSIANPIPYIRHNFELMLNGYQGGIPRLAHIANYILTGKKVGPKGYYNSFADFEPTNFANFLIKKPTFTLRWQTFKHPTGISNAYSGFTDFYGRTPIMSEADDMIDAFLYNKDIDPSFGIRKIAVGENFGPHKGYIKTNYPLKSKNIPVYEMDTPRGINDTEIPILETGRWFGENHGFFDGGNNHMLNAGGHLSTVGETLDGVPVTRQQDIWKFNPTEYFSKWLLDTSNFNYMSPILKKIALRGLEEVDNLGTPVITRTKWHRRYANGKDEDDVTTLRELTVTPNGSYAMASSDDMYRDLQYNIDRAQYENNLNAYNLLRNINAAQEVGAATIGGALASIVGDPLGYGLIKGGASLLNAAKNLPQFARRVWNGGKVIQRNIPISPKNYYRTIVGNDALNDAFNTGIIRGSKSFNGAPYFSHNGLIVLPAGKHAYVIEGTPSTPVQWTGAYQFRVPSKLRPNGSYIPIERVPDASPKSMLPVSEDILTEAIPWSNGSYQVPTNGFTYWQKHPIIGWRNHSFASRGSNMPYTSQWDLANAYADAKAYADSPLRAQLFELLKKEAADAGYISLNSLLLLGRMHSKKPLIKFEDLGPDVLGKYLSDKHQILLNITDPNPLTPYHEYLHSLDVGRPFKDSFTLTKKYKQLKRRATKFGDQEAAKEVMRYSDDAYGMDDFYTHKANQIIESSADPYYKNPLEMDAYGLEEGKRLFMPTFSPKPSDEVLQRMFQQSLNGPYGHFFKHLKVGDNTLDTYWKLLSGLFLPIGLGGAYIMNQNYKNGKDSGIYIKPENRGKFTALKKRTGHSASWFKTHGTPALKKMATFALNARKWKH